MKIILHHCVLAAGLVLNPFSISTPGADGAAPSTSARAPMPGSEKMRGINLDVIGGAFEPKPGVRRPATVGHLAEFIREQFPGVNIVLSPGTSDIKVDELRLRSVDTMDFLQALSVATDGRVQVGKLGTDSYSLRSRPAPEPVIEVFNLSAYFGHTPPETREGKLGAPKILPESQTTEEQLRAYTNWQNRLRQFSAEEDKLLNEALRLIVETVEFAIQSEADRKIDFRFHKEANLLVVRGTAKAIEAARKVVDALNERPDTRPAPVRRELLDE
jgi:hypothetical protein